MNEPQPYLVCRLGHQAYALPIAQVLEVAAMVALTRTPSAPPEVLGIANRHGQPLPVLNLRAAFSGHNESSITPETLFIVVQDGATLAGLVVDGVEGVDYYGNMHPAAGERYIAGIITDAERLIQVIALPALLASFLPANVTKGNAHEPPPSQ